MTDETMITRVARAIHDNPPSETREFEAEGIIVTRDYSVTAKAVIEAMREPTDAMLIAVKPEPTHLYPRRDEQYQKAMKAAVVVSRLGFRSDWQRAIDAALEEGK